MQKFHSKMTPRGLYTQFHLTEITYAKVCIYRDTVRKQRKTELKLTDRRQTQTRNRTSLRFSFDPIDLCKITEAGFLDITYNRREKSSNDRNLIIIT